MLGQFLLEYLINQNLLLEMIQELITVRQNIIKIKFKNSAIQMNQKLNKIKQKNLHNSI